MLLHMAEVNEQQYSIFTLQLAEGECSNVDSRDWLRNWKCCDWHLPEWRPALFWLRKLYRPALFGAMLIQACKLVMQIAKHALCNVKALMKFVGGSTSETFG